VILQVLADARPVEHGRDAGLRELAGGTDAGQFEDLD